MIWEALSKLALLGTERGQLPSAVKEALDKVGLQTDQAPEAVLLEGAALYHQLRRAGFTLQKGEAFAPKDGKAIRPAMPLRAIRQMEHIIRGNFSPALPEALQLIQQAGYAVPPEYLPALFYKSAKKAAFWLTLRPILGPAGFELLRANPDWQALAEREPGPDWPNAPLPERLQVLRRLRFEQPGKATAYISGTWEELTMPEKKALLHLIEIGLGPQDQPFLEARLSDSRKEVRQTAAQLLLQLPDTHLQDELAEAAASWFLVQKDGRLDLRPPQQPVEAFKALGLYSSKKPKYAGGAAAGRAYDILSMVPPKRWEAHFKKSTLDTLRLFTRGNPQALLTDAVANAALLHQDHRWIEALLRHWWRTDNEARWNSTLGKQLMGALPEAVFNDMLSQHLQQHQGYIEEQSFARQLLCLGQHQWEAGVARQVLSGFREWLNAAQSVYWNLWHYKRILQVAAYQAPVSLLAEFGAGWNNRAPVWGNWEKDVDRFLKTLAFRKDLHDAIAT